MMLQSIKHVIPRPWRTRIRLSYPMAIRRLNAVFEKLCHLLPDTWELLTGKRDALTPPRRMIFVGDGDFKEIGQEFFRYFVELGGLQPRDKVLEVGCGIGRMAVPLMDYLKDGGIYEGFDIVEHGIRWCKKKITPRAPHFQFHLADIYNHGYNPTGKHRAAYYRFPYEDETFDFVFLTSVFTHMLPRDMEHYLSEISRVLKSGGRCLITYFLLNDDSNRHIEAGDSAIDFKHRMDGHPQNLIKDLFVPEAAVAYPEHYIKELYENNCLRITQSVCYGSWCGRQEFLSFQDIVVAMKNELKNVLSNE